MVVLTIISLGFGLAFGLLGMHNGVLSFLSEHTDGILYLLMLSVGISVGMQEGLLKRIREYHVKILIIPFGVIFASLLGGVVCSWLSGLPLDYSMAITSGMGWYSLTGVTISQIGGATLGSIAFLSNLLREIFSFFIIPALAAKFNYYTCIASAGATSEDTTLPMMLKYTDEETVVLSVLNGMICSFFVPILISLCLNMRL